MDLFQEIYWAQEVLQEVVVHTPVLKNENLSKEFSADIYLKREDLQPVRSYKIRGAYYKLQSINEEEKKRHVVCASAGNHAQGVAYACNKLNVKATIFMPAPTPSQKVDKVNLLGKDKVKVVLKGDTFDEAAIEAIKFCEQKNSIFIHPFNDEKVIAGQGTIGMELLEDIGATPIDYILLPIGGGGLAAGICTVFQKLSPNTKIIGVEPLGAPSMKTAIDNGRVIELQEIDTFVDGAAVKRVGDKNFAICKNAFHQIILVPEGKVCTTILRLYNEEAIVIEPAGALAIAALDFCKEEIKNKKVVCIVSGSNNDITRMEEIKERSMLYEGLKHYFIVNFPHRPGALKEFVNEVLGEEDDITYFQFSKKNNREKGPAIVGIELKNKNDFSRIEEQLKKRKFGYQYLNQQTDLFTHLIL